MERGVEEDADLAAEPRGVHALAGEVVAAGRTEAEREQVLPGGAGAHEHQLVVLAMDGVEVAEAVEHQPVGPELPGEVAHEAGEVRLHAGLGRAEGERVAVAAGVLDRELRVREAEGGVVAADHREQQLEALRARGLDHGPGRGDAARVRVERREQVGLGVGRAVGPEVAPVDGPRVMAGPTRAEEARPVVIRAQHHRVAAEPGDRAEAGRGPLGLRVPGEEVDGAAEAHGPANEATTESRKRKLRTGFRVRTSKQKFISRFSALYGWS